MKVIECKAVHEWDGGDRHNFAFRISADVPDEVIKKADLHCHIVKETIVIFDSLAEKEDNSVAKLRRRAWDKLTPQERQAIGMQEPPQAK